MPEIPAQAAPKDKIDKITKMLLDKGVLSSQQMSEAQDHRIAKGTSLGKAIVDLGFISERELVDFVSRELNIASIDLGNFSPDQEAIDMVPGDVAKKYRFIPLFKIENTLTIAMADPMDIFAIDDIRFRVGCDIEPLISSESEIMRAIASSYGTDVFIREALDIAGGPESGLMALTEESGADKLEAAAEQAPIVKLVNEIISQAIIERASDIHIEPGKMDVTVRLRIDGVLTTVSKAPINLLMSLVSRIKVMSSMDLVERRIPQDGRMQFKTKNREIDIRVSVYPSVYGEKVVMRLLDQSNMVKDIDKIGFSKRDHEEFKKLLKRPNGIVLVTGPTGSGKSSTLYAGLLSLELGILNVMTIEDPVEYKLEAVTQGQVNDKVGFTFAAGLRSMLRQDPDVIMVGEIRDFETAELAIRAALTGHLVLSTLHTNSAAGAIMRMVDMGVEPFLIASSAVGVLGQRLVRRLCDKCKVEVEISQAVVDQLGVKVEPETKFYKAQGCSKCRRTGYSGRLALFELMVINDEIRRMIVDNATIDELESAGMRQGMKTLRQDGVEKAMKGLTSLDEVMRVTQD